MIQVQIIGNVGKDAVQQRNAYEKAFISFNVAVNEKFQNKDGNAVEKTTWFSCLFNGLNVQQYLKTGTRVFIQGKLDSKVYTDNQGKNIVSHTILVSSLELLSSPKNEVENNQN